jgi:putative heme-binding domain-containing protein
VRSEVVKALGQWPEGQQMLLQQVVDGKMPEELRYPAANVLLTSDNAKIRDEAAKYLTLPVSAGEKALPPLGQLIKRRGDPLRGQDVFAHSGTCAKCHKANGQGTEVGPDLSEIGNKLSAEALYESILNPSAGISHNYEMYKVLLTDGRTLSGILISKTAGEIVLKDKDALVVTIPADDVEELAQQQKSLMPDDLQKQLTEQQLVDVVEFLQTLKK